MLRITVQDEPEQVTLKLEGNLGGIWVTELEDSWRAVNSTLAGRPLLLDLTAVDRVDSAGNYLLALLRRGGRACARENIHHRQRRVFPDAGMRSMTEPVKAFLATD